MRSLTQRTLTLLVLTCLSATHNYRFQRAGTTPAHPSPSVGYRAMLGTCLCIAARSFALLAESRASVAKRS
jgi:hypothetical protein